MILTQRKMIEDEVDMSDSRNTEPRDGDDVGETYIDAVSGKERRKRGKRRHSRGPYSTAEYNMSRAFQTLMGRMHWMHGELADNMAMEFTAWFTQCRMIAERYSYENVPEPTREDWEALREEMSLPTNVQLPEDDGFDLGKLT